MSQYQQKEALRGFFEKHFRGFGVDGKGRDLAAKIPHPGPSYSFDKFGVPVRDRPEFEGGHYSIRGEGSRGSK
jgi:hypothetical protein